MYKNPYNQIVNAQTQENIKQLDSAIKEEMQQSKKDKHRILRLHEQRMMQGLFDGNYGNSYGKYRSPW